MSRWQEQHSVWWDAIDGRNGAVRTVWETLLEMERFDHRAGEMEQEAITLVPDLAQTFWRVGLALVWAWVTQILRVPCGALSLKGVSRSRSRPSRASSLRQWSRLLLWNVLQHALSEVMKVFPSLELKVFVDDTTAFVKGQNKKLPGIAEKLLKSVRRAEKARVEAVNHGRRKGRDEQGDCVMHLSGRELSGMQLERSMTCNQCGDIRSGFEHEREREGRSAT